MPGASCSASRSFRGALLRRSRGGSQAAFELEPLAVLPKAGTRNETQVERGRHCGALLRLGYAWADRDAGLGNIGQTDQPTRVIAADCDAYVFPFAEPGTTCFFDPLKSGCCRNMNSWSSKRIERISPTRSKTGCLSSFGSSTRPTSTISSS